MDNRLMFGIPKSRLETMATFMRDTCLFNGTTLPKVKTDRIYKL